MMLLIKEKCRKYIEERKTRQKRRVEKGIEEKKMETLQEEEPRCNRRKCTARERREITFVEDIEKKGTESKIRIGREID